jgi:hypothetical protein
MRKLFLLVCIALVLCMELPTSALAANVTAWQCTNYVSGKPCYNVKISAQAPQNNSQHTWYQRASGPEGNVFVWKCGNSVGMAGGITNYCNTVVISSQSIGNVTCTGSSPLINHTWSYITQGVPGTQFHWTCSNYNSGQRCTASVTSSQPPSPTGCSGSRRHSWQLS